MHACVHVCVCVCVCVLRLKADSLKVSISRVFQDIVSSTLK